MNQQPIVQFKHTTKIIGRKTIVNDLNFDVLAGEVFGFLGQMARVKRQQSG